MDILCISLRIFLHEQNISRVRNNCWPVNFVSTSVTFLVVIPDQVQSNRGEISENKNENWATIKFAGMFVSPTFKGMSFS